MKRIKNIWYRKLRFDLFLEAEKRASKNKKNRREVILFERNLEENILSIMDRIEKNSYSFGPYTSFVILEPKKRVIRKLPFVDRIVHQWYVEEFLKPYFVPSFIFDSYACLEGKGVLKAVRRVQYFLRKNRDNYVLKMDIHKYFDSVDQDVLFSIMKRKIKDDKLLSFTRKLIYENNDCGLPIGNYTSQFFGNIYLNELDYYIKKELKIKYYVRYLDDFILFASSKDEAKRLFHLIELFLKEKLHLSLNPKSNYGISKRGILFLGYKIYPNYLLIQRKMMKRIKKRMPLNFKSIASYKGLLSHSASRNIVNILFPIPLKRSKIKIE